MLQAYWPVSAEAIQRGEYRHLRRLIVRGVGFGAAIVLLASLGFYLFLGRIGHLLMPADPPALPAALIPLFALYWLVRVWCDTFAVLIQSAGKPIFLCVMVLFQAGLNLVLSYLGARHFGLPGLLVGMTGSFLLTCGWASPLYMRYLARRSAV